MSEPTSPERFPLSWPLAQPRTRARRSSQFKVGYDQTLRELSDELERVGAASVVVSSNMELRADGMPRAGRHAPGDPGVAVYFTRPMRLASGKTERRPFVVACDGFTSVAENLRAIAKTLEAMRAIERWGSAQLADRAYSGFSALPPAPSERPWHEILGVAKDVTNEALRERWHEIARLYHPDIGGDETAFKVCSEAWARASRERGIG